MSSPIPAGRAEGPEDRGRRTAERTARPTGRPQVGDYELLAQIGEGGMGVVHLARRPGGDRVALKVLRPHIVGDDEARARLAREVGSLSRIRSRWVAEIVDADPWAVVPYVATRYVPGLSLHDHVAEEGPLSGRDLTWFAGCLTEGLAAVHAAGVLHRDVKPSNVLMEGRTPILIDFGLARVADDPRLTLTGWLLGTPGYLAPEILLGHDAVPASDVHSWAATVACAATGRPPYGRGPAMAVMDRVRRGEHDLGVAAPGVGLVGDLRDVVEAALDPDPGRRPALGDVLAWLRPLSTEPHDPVLAPPAARGAQGPRPPELLETTAPIGPALLRTVQPVAPLESAATEPAPRTRMLTSVDPPPASEAGSQVFDDVDEDGQEPDDAGVWEPWAPPPPGLAERSRRAGLLLGAGAVAALAVAAYPWVAVLVGLVSAHLLRSGSLAAGAAAERRRLRGRRWYDGPRLLVGAPWDLVRAAPGTLALAVVALGVAVSAGLVALAVVGRGPVTLVAAGLGVALTWWWGPGAARVRRPLGGVVRGVSRTPARWLAGLVVVAVLGGFVGFAAASGPDWAPLGQPSLADPFGGAGR